MKYFCGSHLQRFIYRPYDFSCNYLNKLLENISEKQSIFLLADFSVNLLNYNEQIRQIIF